jgi:hypothetical protein
MSATRDPGLQPERTRLAWRRTALAMTVVVLLAVRLALTGGPAGALPAALAVLGWVAVVTLCWRRSITVGAAAGGGRTLALVGLGTAGFALLGVLLVLRGV